MYAKPMWRFTVSTRVNSSIRACLGSLQFLYEGSMVSFSTVLDSLEN